MKPPHRPGLFGTIRNLDIAHYAVFLGADRPATVYFRHENDGFEENRPLSIRSIKRNNYPNPHMVRGLLEYDLNRPGEDAGDLATRAKVVIELWSYPETLVYLASQYVPKLWSKIEGLRTGTIFRTGTIYREVETDKYYSKGDKDCYYDAAFVGKTWERLGEARGLDTFNKYDVVEVISSPL